MHSLTNDATNAASNIDKITHAASGFLASGMNDVTAFGSTLEPLLSGAEAAADALGSGIGDAVNGVGQELSQLDTEGRSLEDQAAWTMVKAYEQGTNGKSFVSTFRNLAAALRKGGGAAQVARSIISSNYGKAALASGGASIIFEAINTKLLHDFGTFNWSDIAVASSSSSVATPRVNPTNQKSCTASKPTLALRYRSSTSSSNKSHLGPYHLITTAKAGSVISPCVKWASSRVMTSSLHANLS